jgi:hypothetical protein
MNEAEALIGLEACRSLMDKLARQGYDYVYDSADLALVKQHQETIAVAARFSEAAQREVESRFPGKGFLWLTFYQENLADVERRGAEPPSFFNLRLTPPPLANEQEGTIRPFRERLLEHQRDMEDGIATGLLRLSDDAELFYASELAAEIPLVLPLAEKLSARVDAEVDARKAPQLSPKERERLLGVREIMQEYSGQVPKIL